MRKKAIEKKEFSLSSFKAQVGIGEPKEKELEWLILSKAFQEATGLPGIPKSRTTLSRGFSNTGKSTVLFEAAVACQNQGVLPIIIDTENNISRKHLEMMGFDWNGDFIYMDSTALHEKYAKPQGLKDVSIENIADFIHEMLDAQENGQLQTDICFLWDSIGSVDCAKVIKAAEKDSEGNNMWNAGALEKSFKGILNNRIPATRLEGSEYSATLVAVQKIWIDNMAAGVVKHKGGEAFYYGSRLIIHLGGIQSHSTKAIVATKDKRDVSFGIQTKIKVVKNQVNGISLDGSIISTPHGFISTSTESVNDYKKQHLQYFRDELGMEGDFEVKVEAKSDTESMMESIGEY